MPPRRPCISIDGVVSFNQIDSDFHSISGPSVAGNDLPRSTENWIDFSFCPMSKLRSVNTKFWTDPYVLEKLDPSEKLVFLHLLTNERTNVAGAYEISLKSIAFETGFDIDVARRIVERFEADGKLIYHEGWVLMINHRKNQNLNTNMEKGARSIIEAAPDWIARTLQRVAEGWQWISKQDWIERILRNPSEAFESLRKDELEFKSESELEDEPEPARPPQAAVVAGRVLRPFEQDPDERVFIDQVMDGLRSRYRVNFLRDEIGWLDTIDYARANSFTADQVLETFDLMRQQKWREGRITPKAVGDNLIELVRLRAEIERQTEGGSDGKNISRSAAERNGDRALANQRLIDDLRNGRMDPLLVGLSRRDDRGDREGLQPR